MVPVEVASTQTSGSSMSSDVADAAHADAPFAVGGCPQATGPAKLQVARRTSQITERTHLLNNIPAERCPRRIPSVLSEPAASASAKEGSDLQPSGSSQRCKCCAPSQSLSTASLPRPTTKTGGPSRPSGWALPRSSLGTVWTRSPLRKKLTWVLPTANPTESPAPKRHSRLRCTRPRPSTIVPSLRQSHRLVLSPGQQGNASAPPPLRGSAKPTTKPPPSSVPQEASCCTETSATK
mmetsp:Transcript_129083/g.413665  ORF Transcript_129083/g.413665 Transcript_129083/m.413665 type:complete len:237 (-) Transcript_129083:2550-3260(-)